MRIASGCKEAVHPRDLNQFKMDLNTNPQDGQILAVLLEILKQIKLANSIDKPAMNVSELALFLGIPKSTVYHLTCEDKIPHHKAGRRLQFLKDEILAWIAAGGTSSNFKEQ